MNQNKRNRKEYNQGISDLEKFIQENDSEFKQNILISKIFLISGFAGAVFFFLSEASPLIMVLSLIVVIVGLISSLDGYKKAHDFKKYFSPRIPNNEYYIETLRETSALGESISFSNLLPSSNERDAGFAGLYDPNICLEKAFVSHILDNRLLSCSKIPICTDSPTKKFISRLPKIKYNQLVFLVTKVYSKQYRTFNDEKICLDASITELNNAIDPASEARPHKTSWCINLLAKFQSKTHQQNKVKLSKVGYFDGLITNEAFRSRIFEKPEIADNSESKLTSDLTENFPIYLDKDRNPCLYSQPAPSVSRHIGITTIALTADNHIVYFKQSINNMIGAGLLVASGSGSADFADISACSDPENLKTIIKYSMARELCEEGGILEEYYSRSNPKQFIKEVADQTLLTGFFRWVDRCGKPEFVGVTKLKQVLNEIPGDNFEVYISNNMPRGQGKWRIEKLSDFEIFKNELINNNLKINLSFFVALERLIKISRYEHSNDELEKSIYLKVKNFID